MHAITRALPSKGSCVKRISRWHPYNHPSNPTPSSTSSSSSSSFSLALDDAISPYASLSMSQKCTISSSVYVCTPVSMASSLSSDLSSFTRTSSGAPSAGAESDRTTCVVNGGAYRIKEDRPNSANSLVDRAVKILSEAWLPIASCSFPQPLHVPTTQPIGIALPTEASYLSPPNTPPHSPLPQSTNDTQPSPKYPYQSTAEHMPLRQFVHEVLRRSRTSCSTLQTALCYVEAVSIKLPALIAEEVQRIDSQNTPSILAEVGGHEDPVAVISSENPISEAVQAPTPPEDIAPPEAPAPTDNFSKSKRHRPIPQDLPPLPSLPSPLLCPRRTFLASLLLASKFLQDRSYSNKAWAKLTGLPAREIGRCERALSQALEWRLWVGKGITGPFPSDSMDDGGFAVPLDHVFNRNALRSTSTLIANPVPRERRLSKCKSDGALLATTRVQRAYAMHSSTDCPPSAPSLGVFASAFSPLATATSSSEDERSGAVGALTGRYLSVQSAARKRSWPLSRQFSLESASTMSTPSSLLDTQSSLSSVSSFPEIPTPPFTFINSQHGIGGFDGVIEKSTSGFFDMQMEEIVGHSGMS